MFWETQMTRGLISIAALLSLGACATQPSGLSLFTPKPDSAEAALELYYDTLPDTAFPTAPIGKSLPAATWLTIGARASWNFFHTLGTPKNMVGLTSFRVFVKEPCKQSGLLHCYLSFYLLFRTSEDQRGKE